METIQGPGNVDIEVAPNTLLLVDDEENILASLRRLLRKDRYRILCANNGQAGLDILATEKVDVIISDQRMPHMVGTVFLRLARDLSPYSIRMILSGYTDLESVTAAINEGAVYKFLTKPWEDDILRLSIKEALRHKWIQDENRMLHSMLTELNEDLANANRLLTERAEFAQNALNNLQNIMHDLPIAVIGIDGAGSVMFANQAAQNLLGTPFPLGRPAVKVLPAELTPFFEDLTIKRAIFHINSSRYVAMRQPLSHKGQGDLIVFTPETASC